MVTDDERREVAENLRYAADYPGRPIQYMEQFINELREVIFNDFCSEADYSEMFQRLADLIDPGDTSQCCRDTVACDRDALLETADKMRKLGDEEGGPASYAVRCAFRVFARSIYKALGEVVA